MKLVNTQKTEVIILTVHEFLTLMLHLNIVLFRQCLLTFPNYSYGIHCEGSVLMLLIFVKSAF